MTTAETGHVGESAAAECLRAKGYSILVQNWRQGRDELDLVATDGEVLHIVEGGVLCDRAAVVGAADGEVRVELIENALEYNW